MKDSFDYSTYLSPFTIRYGTNDMRRIWSEENRRKLWRKIWVALAKAESKAGLVSSRELADIVAHQDTIDIAKSRKREEKVYHELMSEIQIFSEQCTIGGGKIHLGATSTDILDNATSLQVRESLTLTKKNLKDLLSLFAEKIKQYENLVCIGYTHLQPAEPTTLGYRFAFYAQDILLDIQLLEKIEPFMKGKGLKGAVGTSVSFEALLKNSKTSPETLEKDFLSELGIEAADIANQTYPRKLDLLVVELLANIASSLNKFCFDYRILQSPLYGEWMEKRNSERVGSSAMPFKRNPDRAEKVCSLCRYVSGFFSTAWSNPAHSLLERTLDDSASQRLFLPEAFLAIDDCLKNTKILLQNLEVNTAIVEKNLHMFGQFSATEPLLMELATRGANRQDMHELIKSCSMVVWQGREVGKDIALFDLLAKEKKILRYISTKELQQFASPASHIGLAKKRTTLFLKNLTKILA
ncbi:MAG TPA: adenylosuccinate lyase [Candidatus Eisenbacteria bacterium]|nr:adenylosuccinate lyase [Candidatus Eisenbacteria bacterium]